MFYICSPEDEVKKKYVNDPLAFTGVCVWVEGLLCHINTHTYIHISTCGKKRMATLKYNMKAKQRMKLQSKQKNYPWANERLRLYNLHMPTAAQSSAPQISCMAGYLHATCMCVSASIA